MPIELKVPPVGESVTEVQIGEWLKGEGQRVKRDEIIVKIETDKVTVDLPAPVAGVLTQIVRKQGQSAAVGDVIGFLEEGAEEAAPAPAPAPAPTKSSSPPSDGGQAGDGAKRDSMPAQGFARVMPSARRALKERGLRQEEVEPSGPGGRLLREDVLRHRDVPSLETPASAVGPEEIVPMTPFRRRVAERLLQSQSEAALLTTFNEIDMTNVLALRERYQDRFVKAHGIKLGFMSFFVKAVIDALKSFPAVNGEVRGNDIIYHEFFDVGVAVSTDRGLVVPVLRNAEAMGFGVIEQTIRDFGERARKGSLQMEELTGGTFTITNGGIFGSLMSTPILNPPQSGILGMHKIQERPMVVGGKIEARPMMYLALTYDHRIVDGREAVQFRVHVKDLLEDPARLLLEI